MEIDVGVLGSVEVGGVPLRRGKERRERKKRRRRYWRYWKGGKGEGGRRGGKTFTMTNRKRVGPTWNDFLF